MASKTRTAPGYFRDDDVPSHFVDVLEQGGPPRWRFPPLPRWLVRALVVTAAIVLGVVALQSSPVARAPTPRAAAPPAAAPSTEPGDPIRGAESREPARSDRAVLLLRTKADGRLLFWDVYRQEPVPLPGGLEELAPDASVAPLGRGGVLLIVSGAAHAITAAGQVTDLGPAGTAVPAGFDSAWLVSGAASDRTARLVGIDGVDRTVATHVPDGSDLVGTGPTQLLFGSAYPGHAGPLVLVRPDHAPRRVLPAAVVHDADWRGVVWADCLTCAPRYSELRSGYAQTVTPIALPPSDWTLTGPVLLSPDGRHSAALGVSDNRTGSAQTVRAVIVGHLPGTQRADAVGVHPIDLSPANGELVLRYAKSGWLFASDGQRMVALSPEPHTMHDVPGLPPHELIAAR